MSNDTATKDALKGWLEANGLGQYQNAMAAQDITLDTITDLDDADLRELGVSIGHRKALRRAIEALQDEGNGAESDTGQRRQLTVLFCDLAGSTELARRYDAEDMAAILRKYHDRCYKIIKAWGGRPLGTQGDGVIACFGLPQAQENDAERCVRAALEMSEAIEALPFEDGLQLHSRIGVATGRMYVRGAVEEPGNVVGDALNLAARLQDQAETDTVVLSSGTKRLVEKVARLTSRGAHALKGFAEPEEIWTATGMYEIADRLKDEDPHADHKLIGREAEIGTLKRLWESAKSGQGQVAIISGDAGIGKSYVLDALREIVAPDDHVHMRLFSAPFYENSAMFPVIAQLTHAAGIQPDDTTAEKLGKIEVLFPSNSGQDVALIADLLSLDTEGAYPPLDMTAAEKKQETFGALQRQLLRHAGTQPVLILAEDAHWADPTSLEFLSTIVPQIIPENPILLVVTHRPPLDLGWDGFDHVTHIPLDRLTAEQSREIVARVMGDKTCPPEVLHDIIENADGVPLFVEELARSVADQLDDAGFKKLRLPSSLEDSLRGRLDRLTEGKSLVQTASVFGRRFYLSLLRPILNMDEARLAPAIEEPVKANIIFPADPNSTETMLFRHALVQQAAYRGLLRAQRKELHARIAQLLVEHRPGIAETEPETLARHFAGSGQLPEAIQYLIAAGQRATARAAQIEATNHYLAALDHLKDMPASPERDAQEVLLQALLGGALMATRGFAAPDVYNAFARARELCLQLGDNPMYCSCLYGLFTVNASRSNKAEAVALAEEMLATFGEAPVPSWAIAAHFSMGVALFFLGCLDEAQERFEKAVELYSDDQHAPLVEQFGDNLAEFSLCYLQWLHLQKGQIDLSASYLDRAEKMADDLNNKNAQTRSISFRMGRLQELGDVAAVAEIAPKVIEISMKQGYPYWATAGQIGLGWAMAQGGQPEGIGMIEAGLGFYDMIGQKTPQTYWRTYLIASLIRAGRRDDAIAAADQAIAQCETGLDAFAKAALLRLKGQALLIAPAEPAAAETCFTEGLAFAHETGNRMHGFQCAHSLATLLQGRGRGSEAREALEKAIAGIETTDDFAELASARALLAELSD
ncbi:adenylate/guanylate cyclase domain-containing protein [Marimonas sp. MJW-29]|uniref:Adenylate/guanylate cyclase domain-containing protein n=1 Tax=Sulfitobacter sediminis TaxID=3234186 RepID=A0ABV3RK85_9RHOB